MSRTVLLQGRSAVAGRWDMYRRKCDGGKPANNPAYVRQSPSHLNSGASCNYVSVSLFGIPGVIPVAYLLRPSPTKGIHL